MLAPCLQTVIAKALAIDVAQWYQHAADFFNYFFNFFCHPDSFQTNKPHKALFWPALHNTKTVHCLCATCDKWHMDNLKRSLEASGNKFKSIVRRVANVRLDFMQKTRDLQSVGVAFLNSKWLCCPPSTKPASAAATPRTVRTFQKQTCPGAQKQEVRILAVLFEEDTLGSAGKPANAGFHCWAPALGVWLANPCANTWGWYHQGNCQTSTSQRQAEWQTEGIWRIFFSFFSAYFCLRAPKLPTQAMKSAHTCFPAAPQASGGR